ncbi:hypothetical protein E2C01_076263 [Portunus trituberculatus]|uniref:Uncharacterized protein n=1 Tax=Portunus trituberculatus TaxID=210409 RepID=A0A5B7IHE6_PORTR|nr:hypothetical protein [Portunus trituberculatus]
MGLVDEGVHNWSDGWAGGRAVGGRGLRASEMVNSSMHNYNHHAHPYSPKTTPNIATIV